MIIQLSNFRKLLQKIGVTHWQYIVLGMILTIITPIIWLFLEVKIGINMTIISVVFAFFQGILAYLFMSEKGEARKVFLSLLFSFTGYFLGKYLVFENFYDWYLSAYVDKSEMNLKLILFYFSAMNMDGINLFISEIKSVFNYFDILWIILIICSNLQFLVRPFYAIEKENKSVNKTFKKRRFE